MFLITSHISEFMMNTIGRVYQNRLRDINWSPKPNELHTRIPQFFHKVCFSGNRRTDVEIVERDIECLGDYSVQGSINQQLYQEGDLEG